MNTKHLNRIFARAMYGMVIVAMVLSVSTVVFVTPVAADSKVTVGERLRIREEWMTFSIDTPFHIVHGWNMTSDDDAIGVYDFELEVDGVPRKEDFKDFGAESGDPDTLYRNWVFNFPDGMTGEHTFTGHWFAPCQAAVDFSDYPGPCPQPNESVETYTATLTVLFTLPTFVAYKPGAIEGYDWPMGNVITIDVNDGEYISQANSEQAPDSPEGVTRVLIELWRDDFSIDEGDYIVMTDGFFTKEVVVTNLGVKDIDVKATTISGDYDPDCDLWVWLNGEEWQVPELDPNNGTWVASFAQLPPGAWGGAVQYDFDGDGTSIDFQVPNPTFVAYLPVTIVGYDWPMGDTIDLYINDAYVTGSEVGNADWDPNVVIFNLSDFSREMSTGDHIVMTDDVAGITKEVWVANLAVTGFDPNARQVFGTYDPTYDLSVWLYDLEDQVPETNPDNGTWSATFTELPPGSWIGATQWDTDGDGTSIDFRIPAPRFTVFPEQESLELWEWPIGANVHISIEDPATNESPDYEDDFSVQTADWDPSQSYLWIDVNGFYDIKIGDIVTINDGDTTRTHTTRDLTIEKVDATVETVEGTAASGMQLHVWAHGFDDYEVQPTTGEDGRWVADFGELDFDLTGGMCGRSEIRDELGNATAVDWCVPNTRFTVFPEWNYLEGYEWPDGADVSISVAGKEACSTEAISAFPEWDPWNTFFSVNFPEGCVIEVGDFITLSYESLSLIHQVQELAITDVNLDLDTVAGAAVFDPEQFILHTWIHGIDGSYMQLSVEGGTWLADFGSQGFDLQPGMGGRVEIVDQASNATAVDWWIPNPRFTVFPEWEWFDGYDWPDGTTVSITVDEKSVCNTISQESWGGFFNGGFPEGCDVVVGDVVTFTDGETIRTHTIQNLTITEVNKEANTVSGTAETDALVYAWVHGYGYDMELQVEDGTWLADFGSAGLTLVEGMGGRAEVRDEFGNGTAVDWYIPIPRIVVQITDDWFRAENFTPNAELTFWVYESEGGELLRHPENTWQLDDSGYVTVGMWELEEYIDLVPGNYLVVSDGEVWKELTLEDFTFDVFDLTNAHLQGTAPEPFGRPVWVGIGFENDAWTMDITTDGAGSWLADFGQPVPSDYQWVAAQIFDDDGDASELRPDQVIE
jgi:hypothetical protein